MRASFDTNVLLSYLLNPSVDRAPGHLVQAALEHRFALYLSATTLHELVEAARTKPYLAARIQPATLHDFLAELRHAAVIVPEILDAIPTVTRDPGDDYLVAHAVLQNLDYLATGDKDLLVLNDLVGFEIVTPTVFAEILDTGR